MADIWIGLADAVPVAPADDDFGGAYVHVLAPAGDLLEFRAAAEEALIERGFRLAALDDAEPVRARLRSGSLAPDLLELALDAALGRATHVSEFFAYPAEDREEPEEQADLEALAESGTLVNVRGPDEEHSTIGYVAGVGAQWALIQLVDAYGEPDGFRAVKLGTVEEIDPVDPDHSFLPRLLAARPLTARLPDVGLDDARELLRGAQRLCALVYLVSEDMEAGAFWVGQISALDEDGVLLRKVSPLGTWAGEERFRYEAITRVGFEGGYEHALATAVGVS